MKLGINQIWVDDSKNAVKSKSYGFYFWGSGLSIV
jgi:hypothetical protein